MANRLPPQLGAEMRRRNTRRLRLLLAVLVVVVGSVLGLLFLFPASDY
jgi:hypothetical protein